MAIISIDDNSYASWYVYTSKPYKIDDAIALKRVIIFVSIFFFFHFALVYVPSSVQLYFVAYRSYKSYLVLCSMLCMRRAHNNGMCAWILCWTVKKTKKKEMGVREITMSSLHPPHSNSLTLNTILQLISLYQSLSLCCP